MRWREGPGTRRTVLETESRSGLLRLGEQGRWGLGAGWRQGDPLGGRDLGKGSGGLRRAHGNEAGGGDSTLSHQQAESRDPWEAGKKG